MQFQYKNNKKFSHGHLYTKRLGRILKAHRQLQGFTKKAVQKKLLTLLAKFKHEPRWGSFRALIDPDLGGSISKLEGHGLAHETVFLPDVQLLAKAYVIPELMLDPARSEPVEKYISVYHPKDFIPLKQENVPFYGDGTQYYIPKDQINGTENIAIVRLKLEARPSAFEDVNIVMAHSDSHRHPGEEIIFLMKKGSIEMRFSDSGLFNRLEGGHLIHFDARLDHGAWNLSHEESECLIIRFYQHISRSILDISSAAWTKDLYGKPTQSKLSLKTSTTALAKQQDSKKQHEVIDRQAFGHFLKLLCSERFRGKNKDLSLSDLNARAKEIMRYPFSRSKLDRIQRGQTPVYEDDLPNLAKIYDIEPITLFDFLIPEFHSVIAIHGQEDMIEIKGSFLPEGVTYWHPCRRLAFSQTMIAMLSLEKQCGTIPNRHPGQEIIIILEGRVRLQLGAHYAQLENGDCAHYRSYDNHSVQNIGNKPAKILCIKMIC